MKKSILFYQRNILNVCFLLCILLSVNTINAQTQDTLKTQEKNYKNIIRFNVTNWLIYDNSLQFSYERLLKRKNRSISVFGGYQEFPLNINLNIPNVEFDSKSTNKYGYTLGFEYRFYLKKENKYDAPHGIYLAPYTSFLQFNTDRNLDYNNNNTIETTTLNTKINILNIGGSLGYQFVIQKRWVIDAVVFGPAVSSYKFKAKLKSELSGVDNGEILQEVIKGLKERFPLLEDVSSDKGATRTGTQAFWSGGFRYSISIGYRF